MTEAVWRTVEPDSFADAVTAAASRLGVLPLAVEKDYWACEALRAITQAHPGEVVFKGGTSLEKLRIIRRFSEDLDLLVIGRYDSNRAPKRAMKAMIQSAAEATAGVASEHQGGGAPGSYHRRAYLSPPLAHSGDPGAIADAAAILIELGQSGGPNPHRIRYVSSLLSRELAEAGFEVTDWADLNSFEVAVLHPGRTLLEKLLRINNFAANPDTQGTHGWPRIGRQFYDVWALLGTDEVLEFLADRPLVADVLADCLEVSKAFAPDLPPPPGGFSACSAFAADGPLSKRLSAEHDTAMAGLYYGIDAPPSFAEVLARIETHRELLDPESAA